MKNIIRLGIDIGSTTVKIACLDKENKIDKKKSMNSKTGLQRFLILFAGAGWHDRDLFACKIQTQKSS